MLNNRLEHIFKILIAEHLENGAAVGSKILARDYDLDLSSATVRNNLAELEELGFIYKPNFGVGRLPTDKGWRYYVDYLDDAECEKDIKSFFGSVSTPWQIAKTVANLTNAFGIVHNYKTDEIRSSGLANLFEAFERQDADIHSVINFVEEFEEVFDDFLDKINKNIVEIFIGSENPLQENKYLSTMALRIPKKIDIVIIGPKCMHYGRNKEILETAGEYIS